MGSGVAGQVVGAIAPGARVICGFVLRSGRVVFFFCGPGRVWSRGCGVEGHVWGAASLQLAPTHAYPDSDAPFILGRDARRYGGQFQRLTGDAPAEVGKRLASVAQVWEPGSVCGAVQTLMAAGAGWGYVGAHGSRRALRGALGMVTVAAAGVLGRPAGWVLSLVVGRVFAIARFAFGWMRACSRAP